LLIRQYLKTLISFIAADKDIIILYHTSSLHITLFRCVKYFTRNSLKDV